MNKTQFEFRGDGIIFFLFWFVTPVIAIITLYMGMPWIYCWKKKWLIGNSFINNRKLIFKGTGAQVFGLFIKIFFFSIFTLGLYIPFGIVSIKRWELKHTFFEDEIHPNGKVIQQNDFPNIVNPTERTDDLNLLLQLQSKVDDLEVTCFNCNAQLELDKEELKNEFFVCPVCKAQNTIKAKQVSKLEIDNHIDIAKLEEKEFIESIGIEEKDFICKYCKSILTLEGDELNQETYTCPVCNKLNKITI